MRFYTVSRFDVSTRTTRYFRPLTSTWQNHLDENCLSSDKCMMEQIRNREQDKESSYCSLDEYDLVLDKGF